MTHLPLHITLGKKALYPYWPCLYVSNDSISSSLFLSLVIILYKEKLIGIGKIWGSSCCTSWDGEESGDGRVNAWSHFAVSIWPTQSTTFTTVCSFYLRQINCVFKTYYTYEALWRVIHSYSEWDTHRSGNQSPSTKNINDQLPEPPQSRISLLARPFGLGWRDKNKVSLLLTPQHYLSKPNRFFC